MNSSTSNTDRRAFTLIELIVVMGIIAALVGTVSFAVATFVSNARHSATRTLVIKIDRLLESRREAMDRFFSRADNRAGDGIPEYMTNNLERNLFSQGRKALARTIARKRFYKQAFPQTFQEADIDGSSTNGSYRLTDGTIINSTTLATHTAKTEAAEMLYWFVTNGAQFGDVPVGTGEFLTSEVRDTDGDGLLEFVDAWGEPLRFYRWPTRLFRPQPSGSEDQPQTDVGPPGSSPDTILDPQNNSNHFFIYTLVNNLPDRATLGVDQDDEFGLVIAETNAASPLFTPTVFENNFHTVETWHHPLILSTGEDRQLGLYAPNNFTEYGYLAQPEWETIYAVEDNISNLFLRTGGR